MDGRIKFTEKFLFGKSLEQREFTSTETLEQYTARGGAVTKVSKVPTLWTHAVNSTSKRGGSRNVPRLYNAESDEL